MRGFLLTRDDHEFWFGVKAGIPTLGFPVIRIQHNGNPLPGFLSTGNSTGNSRLGKFFRGGKIPQRPFTISWSTGIPRDRPCEFSVMGLVAFCSPILATANVSSGHSSQTPRFSPELVNNRGIHRSPILGTAKFPLDPAADLSDFPGITEV